MTYTYPARRDQRYGVALPSLRFYRTNRGISQETLAHKAGISASTILHIEKHGGRARLATITALAQALRVEKAALTLPAPDTRPARYAPPRYPAPPITRQPELDLSTIDALLWPPNVIVFAQRAPAARARRALRRDAQLHRSHRDPWA